MLRGRGLSGARPLQAKGRRPARRRQPGRRDNDPGAFEQSLTPIQLYVVSNGERAIKFVQRTDADAPRPSLILLDLNLPIRNGLEVLAELKSDTEFLSIPIVVLTTSQAPNDIQQCYSLHANAYIIKPPDFDGYADVIKQVATCFLGLISLPP
jgi:CheY-like chemotaxis protein